MDEYTENKVWEPVAQSHNLIEMQMVLQSAREYLAYCKKTNLENSISFVQETPSLI